MRIEICVIKSTIIYVKARFFIISSNLPRSTSLFVRANIKTATSLRFDLVDFNVEITFPDEKNLIETYDPVDNC